MGAYDAVIEIPKGSRNKYEVDHETGRVYLDRVLTRLTLPGAIYLAIIAELPNIVFRYLPDSNVFFGVLGGTSILIVVGVALDTMRQMEAQLMMRSYEGFLK